MWWLFVSKAIVKSQMHMNFSFLDVVKGQYQIEYWSLGWHSFYTRHVLLMVHSFPCVAQAIKNLSAMQNIWVQSLGWEDPLEKEMATHSSILAWRIPWTEEPGGLQSIGSQRVGHDWVTNTSAFNGSYPKDVRQWIFFIESYYILCRIWQLGHNMYSSLKKKEDPISKFTLLISMFSLYQLISK